MHIGRWLVIIALVLGFSQDAAGRSLRCNGRLVMIGDYLADVEYKCGMPDHVDSYKLYPDTWVSKHYDYEEDRFKAPYLLKGPINQEIWIYRFGRNRLPYYLYFHNGRLTHLETGRRRP